MKKLIVLITTILLISGNVMNLQAAEDDDNKDRNNKTNTTNTVALKGQVKDVQSGETLTGVKIQVEGANVSAFTDFEGNFKVTGLKPGTYKLKTSFISYKDKTLEDVKLEVNENNDLSIRMKSLEE
jgi:protocatechuate 3,4-dioxygenase beta subunit